MDRGDQGIPNQVFAYLSNCAGRILMVKESAIESFSSGAGKRLLPPDVFLRRSCMKSIAPDQSEAGEIGGGRSPQTWGSSSGIPADNMHNT